MAEIILPTDSVFHFKLPEDGLSLHSAGFSNEGAPELRFKASPKVPTLQEEDVATIFRLANENKRPNFFYIPFPFTHPLHDCRFFMEYYPTWLRGTKVGKLLADADWNMKCLHVGVRSNEDKTSFKSWPLSSNLEGLATHLDFPMDGMGPVMMTCDHVTTSQDDNEIIFLEEPKMKITDHSNSLYSKYITEHYPAVGYYDQPVFLKMQELIKLIVAVEWFHEKGVKMNQEWMMDHTSKNKEDRKMKIAKKPPPDMIPKPSCYVRPSKDVTVKTFDACRNRAIARVEEQYYGYVDFGGAEIRAFKADGTECPPLKCLKVFIEDQLESQKTISGWVYIPMPPSIKVENLLRDKRNEILKAWQERQNKEEPKALQTNTKVEDLSTKDDEVKVRLTESFSLSSLKRTLTMTATVDNYAVFPEEYLKMPIFGNQGSIFPDVESWEELLHELSVPRPAFWQHSIDGIGKPTATGGVTTSSFEHHKVSHPTTGLASPFREPVTMSTGVCYSTPSQLTVKATSTQQVPIRQVKSSAEHVREPVKMSTSQSVKASTSQPVKTSTSQSVKTSTSQPVKTSTSQPVKMSTSQPVKMSTSQSVKASTSQPVKMSTSQPVKTSTSQPVKMSTSQPVKTSTSQPVKMSTSQPVKMSTSQPVKMSTSQPVKTSTSQPVKTSTSQPVKASTSQPLKMSTSQPVKTSTSQPLKMSTSQPVKMSTSQPVKMSTSQPVKTSTSQPVKMSTSQPVKMSTSQPVKTSTSQPVKASTSQPLKMSTSQPVKTSTSQPLKMSTSQPVKTSTSQPVKASTSQPLKMSTSQPVKTSTSQPVKASTSQPLKMSTSQPVKTSTSQSVKASTSQPLKMSTSQPVKTSTSQPVKMSTSQPVKVSTSPPVKASTSQPLKMSTSQPVKMSTSQPLKMSTSQPLKMSTSQPVKASTSQPVKASTSQPVKMSTSQPVKMNPSKPMKMSTEAHSSTTTRNTAKATNTSNSADGNESQLDGNDNENDSKMEKMDEGVSASAVVQVEECGGGQDTEPTPSILSDSGMGSATDLESLMEYSRQSSPRSSESGFNTPSRSLSPRPKKE